MTALSSRGDSTKQTQKFLVFSTKSPQKFIDNSLDNGIYSIRIASILNSTLSTNIKVGGQVCVSEGCDSSHDAQPGVYRHVDWALFPPATVKLPSPSPLSVIARRSRSNPFFREGRG